MNGGTIHCVREILAPVDQRGVKSRKVYATAEFALIDLPPRDP